jgi:hypothetical protein
MGIMTPITTRAHELRGQLLRIVEHGRDVSGIAAEADQGKERIAINWMPSQVLFESSHRLAGTSSRVQFDDIHISISRLVGVEFDGPVQFLERFVWLLQSHQNQSKGVLFPDKFVFQSSSACIPAPRA